MSVPYRYFDVRRVAGESTHIDIDNSVIESAGMSYFDKAIIRVLGDFGWGMLEVTGDQVADMNLPHKLLEETLSASKISNERVEIADTSFKVLPVPKPKEDPRDVSIEEKSQILLDTEKQAKIDHVTNTRVTYAEKVNKVSFFNSLGDEFEYEICRSGFNVLAVATRGSVVQMGYERRHSISGLNIRHQHNLASEAAGRAVAMLDAKPAKGGIMNAVLDQELAGVFAHEAVGHAAEGDLVYEGNSVLGGNTGEKVGSSVLTIVDDPTLEEFGFCPVDDEGTATQRTEIIKNGILKDFLHSKETLASVGNGVAGHARGMPGDTPIVRMSNTFIENHDSNLEEILEVCGDGILLKGSRGGQVDPGRGVFQFNAEYGYLVRNGECTDMVRDVSLSGDILKTLHSVKLCGNDRHMNPGYCGKSGQSVPVSDGAPHILLANAVVGGSELD